MICENTKSGIRYLAVNKIPKESRKLPVISLFSGAGGLDIGLEQAGFRTAVCVEYDADCRETLRFNRPEWKLFESGKKLVNGKLQNRIPGDIRDIEADELLDLAGLKKGEAALVVGGAPCQPFSNIGKKLGKEDQKNGDLFLEFVRIVRDTEPAAFIFENVVGITQQKHAEVLECMADQFKGLGFGISYTVLNAANYGVPQKRERFFLIGIRNTSNPAFPFPAYFKDEKHYREFIKALDKKPVNGYKKWVSVQDAFDKIEKDCEKRSDYTLMNISEAVQHRMTHIKQGENFKVLPMELRPECWKSGKHQGHDTFGRLVAELPSVTIRTAAYNPSKGRYIHPFENRGLHSMELAALQSFPPDWTFRSNRNNRITLVSAGKQIGNAVPPLLAKYLGLALREQM